MRLGEVLRAWRAVRGISTRDAALSIGTNITTINRIENGKGINTETFAKIVHWLMANETDDDKETPKP